MYHNRNIFKSSAGSIVSSFLQILFYYTSYFPKSGKIKDRSGPFVSLFQSISFFHSTSADTRVSTRPEKGDRSKSDLA